MIRETSLNAQLEAVKEDRLRVLVVGAGIAGMTLAQLLRRRGLHPVLVERTGPDAPSGYMLALMPLVDPVLQALGVTEEYVSRGVGMGRYRIRNRHGSFVREYTMGRLLDVYGDYRGISRGELMRVLESPGGAVTYKSTVSALEQRPETVVASIDVDGEITEAEFDVVVAADGLRSATRGLVLGRDQVTSYDTGWGGWVVWIDDDADSDLGEELWGTGAFVGTYPVKDEIGAILCGPRSQKRAGIGSFVERLRREIPEPGERIRRVFEQAADGRPSYYWTLNDCRCPTWSVGRVGLLGDAAAGFLPTAGIGAGMAMESAWVLADALGDCPAGQVRGALGLYERNQRPRVEAAQTNSRQLAPLMFNESRTAAAVRDSAARFVPLGLALRPIRKLLETRPVLD